MSDAILILDGMPHNCEECCCSYEKDYETICSITGKRDIFNERPPWCPLHPEEVLIEKWRIENR